MKVSKQSIQNRKLNLISKHSSAMKNGDKSTSARGWRDYMFGVSKSARQSGNDFVARVAYSCASRNRITEKQAYVIALYLCEVE